MNWPIFRYLPNFSFFLLCSGERISHVGRILAQSCSQVVEFLPPPIGVNIISTYNRKNKFTPPLYIDGHGRTS